MVKHLQAFTILELVIVMILTGIASGIIYMVLNIFMFQYTGFGKTAGYMLDYYACKRQLEGDFNASHLLEKSGDSLICVKDKGKVAYYFGNQQYILRVDDEINIDTFQIQYNIPDWEITMVNARKVPLIRRLSIIVLGGGEQYPWVFTKHYDESALFNFETDN